MKKSKLPFALGLTGAILCIIGGFCVALCGAVADALTAGNTNYQLFGWIFGVGGGAVALTGAIISIYKEKIGGVLMLLSVGMLVGLCITTGFLDNIVSLIGGVFVLTAGCLDLAAKVE